MKKVIRIVILVIAFGVFIYSALQLVRIYDGYHKGESEYEELEKLVVINETESDGTDSSESGTGRFKVDFEALRKINPEVVAWIRFEEPAVINYPVVQGKDNEKYLHQTFRGYDNTVGTIFINADNASDLSDRNTIIYGHYMNNGTMFNQLEEYQKKSFWEKYPYFYIYTPDGKELKYHIYSAGIVKNTSAGYTYRFENDDAFTSFIEVTKKSSFYDTGITPGLDAHIVTLSTCTKASNNDRMVLHAVRE